MWQRLFSAAYFYLFMNNIITSKELLQKFDMSRSTLHRYKTRYGFPFIKVGGKTFYNMEDVELFLREHSSHVHKNTKNDKVKN